MLKKLLGGKKDEFFVQLDEDKNAVTEKGSSEVLSSPSPEPAAVTPVTPVQTPQPAPKKTKKTKGAAPPAPAPVVVAPAPKPQPTQVEFATKYLITDTLVRRQPGPSLNKFKEMARNLKAR